MAETQVKRLVIVESPAKAKTIQKYLGEGYVVEASVGHIRDLPQRAAEVPKEFKKNKWASLGIDIESDFEPLYVVDSAKQSRVNDLKKELKSQRNKTFWYKVLAFVSLSTTVFFVK